MLTVNGVKGTPKNFDNFEKEEKNASAGDSEGSKAFGKEGITDKCRNGLRGVRKWASGFNETVKGHGILGPRLS